MWLDLTVESNIKLLSNHCCTREFDLGYHTFMETDHEIISILISSFHWFKKGCIASYKRKDVHEVLVNRLVPVRKGPAGIQVNLNTWNL